VRGRSLNGSFLEVQEAGPPAGVCGSPDPGVPKCFPFSFSPPAAAKKRSTRGLSGDSPHPGLGLAPLASLLKEVIAKKPTIEVRGGGGSRRHLPSPQDTAGEGPQMNRFDPNDYSLTAF